MSEQFSADIHLHSTLRPYNLHDHNAANPVAKKTDIWFSHQNTCNKDWHKKFLNIIKAHTIPDFSQTSIKQLYEGNIKLVMVSIFPLEKQFANLNIALDIPPLHLNERTGWRLMECLSGINEDKLEWVDHSLTDYWPGTLDEYNYFIDPNRCQRSMIIDGKKVEISFVNSYDEIKQNMAKSTYTISVMLCLEGIQCLGPYLPVGTDPNLLKKTLDNLELLRDTKKWTPVPFYITFCHHFWNGFAGHAASVIPQLFMWIPAVTNFKKGLLDQDRSKMQMGLSKDGKEVITELYKRSQTTRRILVDVKHMSARVRQEFYKLHGKLQKKFKKYDPAKPTNHYHNIPILCSHTGMTTYTTLSDLVKAEDSFLKIYPKTKARGFRSKARQRSFFFEWSINLSKEEVKIIHDSDGLIGLQMDLKRIGGEDYTKQITKIKSAKKQKDAFIALLAGNLLKMVEAVGEASAWDILCIGSDMDGLVATTEYYTTPNDESFSHITCAHRTDMKDSMTAFLNSGKAIQFQYEKDGPLITVYSKEQIKALLFGLDAADLMDRVFSTNVQCFLEKYYTDTYLLKQTS